MDSRRRDDTGPGHASASGRESVQYQGVDMKLNSDTVSYTDREKNRLPAARTMARGSGDSKPAKPGNIKTKIVCTLGPASRDPETLRQMVEAGMDVARINSSHCEPDGVRDYIKLLRDLEAKTGKHVGIMLDLQGPRLRVGQIEGSQVELTSGQSLTLSTEQEMGTDSRISVSHRALTSDLAAGDTVLIDDGLIRLQVNGTKGTEITCTVIEGGVLRQGKGMNFPGVPIRLPSFTDRDRSFLEVGLEVGVDWISQSFVRDGYDVRALRETIAETGHNTPIMAKIEKSEAVANIDDVLEMADGIMVARGDLGVEMLAEEVPLVQKQIILKALLAAKPVVTATQMLESMVVNPRPTRAEASDVANAILDGTDAVMLSAETAAGAHPVRAVEMMARIAAMTEGAIDYSDYLEEGGRWAHCSAPDALGFAACKIASDLGASAIIGITRFGYTAHLLARYRPASRIIAISPVEKVMHRLSPLWGVRGIVMPLVEDLTENILIVVDACKKEGYVSSGDLVVVVGGFLEEKIGTTNMINLHTVE